MESTEGDAPAVGLAALLDLEVLDRDLFRGQNEEGAGARMSLYGGQVAAQALRGRGLDGSRTGCRTRCTATSCARAASTVRCSSTSIAIRDGGSFSARHVRAVQDGEVIFSMVASFHAREDSARVRRGSDPWRTGSVDTDGASFAVPGRRPGSDADAHRQRSGSPLGFAVGAGVDRRSPTIRWRTPARSPTSPTSARGSGRWRSRASRPADRASTTACGSTNRSAPTIGCCSSCGR